MRRLLRWSLELAVLALLAVVAAAPVVHERAVRAAEQAIAAELGARVRLGRVSSLASAVLSGRLQLDDVRAHRHGAWRVAVERVVIRFVPRALLDRHVDVRRIDLAFPTVAATDAAPASLPAGGGGGPSPVRVTIGRVTARDGRVAVAVGAGDARRLYGADRLEADLAPTFGVDRWRLAVSRLALRPRGVRVPPIVARGMVKGRAERIVARVDATLARTGAVHVTTEARLGEPLDYRVAARTSGLAATPLVPGAPIERVRGEVAVHGRRGAGSATLGYTADVVADVRRVGAVTVGVAGHARGSRHRVDATAGAAGVRVTIGGTVDVEASSVAADVRATADLATLARRVGVVAGGRATVNATVTGALASPRVALAVDATSPSWGTTRLERLTASGAVDGVPGARRVDIARAAVTPVRGPAWALAAPTTVTIGPAIVLAPTTIAGGATRVSVAGRLGPGDAVELTVDVPRIDLAATCRAFGAGECTGAVTARARVAGTGPAPELEATVRHSIGATVSARGTVPFPWPTGGPALDRIPFALDVRSDGFDVAALQPLAGGALVQLGGRLEAAVVVRGPLHDVTADGRARLVDGRLEPTATRVRYEDVSVELHAAPGAVVVDSLSARAGGTLRGSGRLALDGLRPGPLDVALVADRLRIVGLRPYEAAASGRLAVTGDLTAPVVAGDVVVGPAVIRPEGLPSGDVSTAPDPTIEVVGGPAAPAAPTGVPSLVEALALDLAVRIGDDVTVRRADARIDLGGQLAVTKAAYQPVRVTGDVRLLRGWATFQGRRFTIEPSAIHFDGPPGAPTLDVTATTRSGAYDVTVLVTGRPRKPELNLTSDPPLEESDVLAVLLFGVPTHELGEGQQVDLQRRAVGLASAYVAGDLTRSVRDRLGLDVFDVVAGQGDQPGEVRVGRYVTNDIFLSIAQEFGSRVGQAATVEYRLRPRLSVRLSTSTSGSSGIDVLWHRRY